MGYLDSKSNLVPPPTHLTVILKKNGMIEDSVLVYIERKFWIRLLSLFLLPKLKRERDIVVNNETGTVTFKEIPDPKSRISVFYVHKPAPIVRYVEGNTVILIQ